MITRFITELKADPFGYFAFLLQFAPTTGPAAVEISMREKFARIGIEAGKPFPSIALSDADKTAMKAAVTPAEEAIKKKLETIGKPVEGWILVTSGIGDRAVYNSDWAQRADLHGIAPVLAEGSGAGRQLVAAGDRASEVNSS